jgi:uncharacterized protein
MNISKYRRPFLFYALATLIPWTFWFSAAWISHRTPYTGAYLILGGALGIIGLASPMAIAFILMLRESELREDLVSRVFSLKRVKVPYAVIACSLMLISILLAMAISLFFGHSADQFRLARHFSFSGGIFPAWFLLLLAPLLEELAWHSYGTDCLRARMNLFTASLIFAIFWSLWHFPLAFIKDYYHSNLAASGTLYSINFCVSLIPYVLLMNWLYYKTGRNILVAVVFHVSAGFFNEIFATHPDSKVIQTGLLLVLTAALVAADRDFFFKRTSETGE